MPRGGDGGRGAAAPPAAPPAAGSTPRRHRPPLRQRRLLAVPVGPEERPGAAAERGSPLALLRAGRPGGGQGLVPLRGGAPEALRAALASLKRR